MKIKVVHFVRDYYTVRYQWHWWLPYWTINEACTKYFNPSLNTLNGLMAEPLLMKFEEAKAFAESFTEVSLRAYLLKQREDFNCAQNDVKRRLKEIKSKGYTISR